MMAAFGEAPYANEQAERTYNLDAHRPMPTSRDDVMLDIDARESAEKAERAAGDARRRLLSRGTTFTVGRVGTQLGREIEVLSTTRGIVVRDPGKVIHDGILFALSADQTRQLVGLLTEAVDPERLNHPAHYGPVGRVGRVEVERTATGTVIRDTAIRHHAGTLAQLNSDQTSGLRDLLVRALPE